MASGSRQIDAISIGIGANIQALRASLAEAQTLVSNARFTDKVINIRVKAAESDLRKTVTQVGKAVQPLRTLDVTANVDVKPLGKRNLLKSVKASLAGEPIALPFTADLKSAKTIRDKLLESIGTLRIPIELIPPEGGWPTGSGPSTPGGGTRPRPTRPRGGGPAGGAPEPVVATATPAQAPAAPVAPAAQVAVAVPTAPQTGESARQKAARTERQNELDAQAAALAKQRHDVLALPEKTERQRRTKTNRLARIDEDLEALKPLRREAAKAARKAANVAPTEPAAPKPPTAPPPTPGIGVTKTPRTRTRQAPIVGAPVAGELATPAVASTELPPTVRNVVGLAEAMAAGQATAPTPGLPTSPRDKLLALLRASGLKIGGQGGGPLGRMLSVQIPTLSPAAINAFAKENLGVETIQGMPVARKGGKMQYAAPTTADLIRHVFGEDYPPEWRGTSFDLTKTKGESFNIDEAIKLLETADLETKPKRRGGRRQAPSAETQASLAGLRSRIAGFRQAMGTASLTRQFHRNIEEAERKFKAITDQNERETFAQAAWGNPQATKWQEGTGAGWVFRSIFPKSLVRARGGKGGRKESAGRDVYNVAALDALDQWAMQIANPEEAVHGRGRYTGRPTVARPVRPEDIEVPKFGQEYLEQAAKGFAPAPAPEKSVEDYVAAARGYVKPLEGGTFGVGRRKFVTAEAAALQLGREQFNREQRRLERVRASQIDTAARASFAAEEQAALEKREKAQAAIIGPRPKENAERKAAREQREAREAQEASELNARKATLREQFIAQGVPADLIPEKIEDALRPKPIITKPRIRTTPLTREELNERLLTKATTRTGRALGRPELEALSARSSRIQGFLTRRGAAPPEGFAEGGHWSRSFGTKIAAAEHQNVATLNTAEWKKTRRAQLRRQPFCSACGIGLPEARARGIRLTADKIQPQALGGNPFDPANLDTLCTSCNAQKGALPALSQRWSHPRPRVFEHPKLGTPARGEFMPGGKFFGTKTIRDLLKRRDEGGVEEAAKRMGRLWRFVVDGKPGSVHGTEDQVSEWVREMVDRGHEVKAGQHLSVEGPRGLASHSAMIRKRAEGGVPGIRFTETLGRDAGLAQRLVGFIQKSLPNAVLEGIEGIDPQNLLSIANATGQLGREFPETSARIRTLGAIDPTDTKLWIPGDLTGNYGITVPQDRLKGTSSIFLHAGALGSSSLGGALERRTREGHFAAMRSAGDLYRHEFAHAVDNANDSYGTIASQVQPGHLSKYAHRNPSEDFAETFSAAYSFEDADRARINPFWRSALGGLRVRAEGGDVPRVSSRMGASQKPMKADYRRWLANERTTCVLCRAEGKGPVTVVETSKDENPGVKGYWARQGRKFREHVEEAHPDKVEMVFGPRRRAEGGKIERYPVKVVKPTTRPADLLQKRKARESREWEIRAEREDPNWDYASNAEGGLLGRLAKTDPKAAELLRKRNEQQAPAPAPAEPARTPAWLEYTRKHGIAKDLTERAEGGTFKHTGILHSAAPTSVTMVGERGTELLVSGRNGQTEVVPHHQVQSYLGRAQEGKAYPNLQFRDRGRFTTQAIATEKAAAPELSSPVGVGGIQRVFVTNWPGGGAFTSGGGTVKAGQQIDQRSGSLTAHERIVIPRQAAATASAIAGETRKTVSAMGMTRARARRGVEPLSEEEAARAHAEEIAQRREEEVLLSRAQSTVRRAVMMAPTRAPATTGGQIFGAIGGRAAYMERVSEAQALGRVYALEIAKQRRDEGRLSRTRVQLGKETDTEKQKQIEADIEDQTKALEVQKGVVKDTGDAYEIAQKKIGGLGSQMRIQAFQWTGFITTSLAFGFGMGMASKGMEELGKAIDPAVERMTGFWGITNKTTSAMSDAVRQHNGLTKVVIAQTAAEAGLSDEMTAVLGSTIKTRIENEAGAKAVAQQMDLLHMQSNLRQGNTGLFQPAGGTFGTTRAVGGFLGSPLGATPSLMEQLANEANNGLNPDVFGQFTPKTMNMLEAGIGGAIGGGIAGAAAGTPVFGIGAIPGAIGGALIGGLTATGIAGAGGPATPPASFRGVPLPGGTRGYPAPAAEKAPAVPDLFKQTVDDFNSEAEKAGSAFSLVKVGSDSLGKSMLEATRASLKAAGASNDQADAIIKQGYALKQIGNQGPVGLGAGTQYLADIISSSIKPTLEQLATQAGPQIQAQIGGFAATRQAQIQYFNPAETAMQFFGQRPQGFGAGYLQNVAAPGFGAQTIAPRAGTVSAADLTGVNPMAPEVGGQAAQSFNQYRGTAESAIKAVSAAAEEGRQALLKLGVPSDVLDSYKSLSDEVAGVQAGISSEQAGYRQMQYNQQLFITRRNLADANALYSSQDSALGHLGYLQRQQINLDREQTRLQFWYQQRQINFQRALAGLQAPGETPEERAARRANAELEAQYAQTQLNLSKQSFNVSIEVFGEGTKRQISDLNYALKDLTTGRKIELDGAAAEQTIAALNAQMAIQAKKIGAYTQEGESVISAEIAMTTDWAAQTGKAWGDVQNAAATAWNKWVIGIEPTLYQISSIMAGMGAINPNLPSSQYGEHGHYAAGFYGDVNGKTQMTVGEAGNETVAILSNPRKLLANIGSSGPGGSGAPVILTVNINGPVVRDEKDIRSLAAEVERILNVKTALLGLRMS